MNDLEREVPKVSHRPGGEQSKPDRELEISIVMVQLGLSFSSVRRLMDRKLLRWTRRGPRKGLRVFESSVKEYKKLRDQECM